jgi:hypothetical protein
MMTVSFIPAPATMTELTSCQAKDATSTSRQSASFQLATMTELASCQAKDATSTSRQSASFQLQPLRQNLLSVNPRMPQAHQDSQLHSSSSHHDRTYSLSSQGCHQHIKTVSFIPASATMTELTNCQAKDATSTSRQSASFQLQPP